MGKPIDLQYTYKKILGFTNQQKKAFEELEKHNVNINRFIRAAIKEKIKRDWPKIKQESINNKCPF